ncbi:flagellar basal body L-ring protein, partial [Cupriavidus pinatubonensis]
MANMLSRLGARVLYCLAGLALLASGGC